MNGEKSYSEKMACVFIKHHTPLDWLHKPPSKQGKNHKKIDISLRVIARIVLLTTNNEGNLFQPSIKVHLEEEKV